ncbi:hypothetical protein HB852_09930 [Listeria grandensis]|uniref:hypothetical protein n=1 Tax=Listeria grandensis TaxID=1494963 RepID=UPI00162A1DDA|nr:hypothetical protein [Listeria grandensis]MBC1474936.1 hypothetical protein [Listeria grandensis]
MTLDEHFAYTRILKDALILVESLYNPDYEDDYEDSEDERDLQIEIEEAKNALDNALFALRIVATKSKEETE